MFFPFAFKGSFVALFFSLFTGACADLPESGFRCQSMNTNISNMTITRTNKKVKPFFIFVFLIKFFLKNGCVIKSCQMCFDQSNLNKIRVIQNLVLLNYWVLYGF